MFEKIRNELEQLHNGLREHQATLSVAESCTGGLLGAAITSLSGSSDVFEGGAISYSDDLKKKMLNVDPEVLVEHGAVSRPVARQMTTGAADAFGTAYAVGITGIAGPAGGTEDKPVGLVHFGFELDGMVRLEKRVFDGNRTEVRFRSVRFAIKILVESFEDALG